MPDADRGIDFTRRRGLETDHWSLLSSTAQALVLDLTGSRIVSLSKASVRHQ